MRAKQRLGLFMVLVLLVTGVSVAQEKKEGGTNTGNDPRDFSSKFMPYYRQMELENGMKVQDFTVFGMWAMTSKFALTYEVPIARKYDITDTEACAGLPSVDCTGSVPGGGFLPNGLPAEGDGEEVGMGDSIVRIF